MKLVLLKLIVLIFYQIYALKIRLTNADVISLNDDGLIFHDIFFSF